MKILAINSGHDGSIAFIEDGKLIFSIEAEKDSFPRYSEISAQLMVEALDMAPNLPDIVAIGGWHKHLANIYSGIASGYFGLQSIETHNGHFFGKSVKIFSSSHERSHIFMAVGMAPWAPIEECIILVWEGVIGTFYHWKDYGAKILPFPVLSQPGARYSALFALGDPRFPDSNADPQNDYSGKLMALAGYSKDNKISEKDRVVIEKLLNFKTMYPFDKASLRQSEMYNCGVHTKKMHDAARYINDQIFQIFYNKAKNSLPHNLPLVISGGCGLNCDWNQRWRECGLFSKVFVPPCTNDSGSTIGTAIDAMAFYGEPCRLDWSVYAGAPFLLDTDPNPYIWRRQPLNLDSIAFRLSKGDVFAWVEGRYEIGPRALGHRSLLASPIISQSKDILNNMKEREEYRPIAPCCLYEDLNDWFEPVIDDPYMLYFSKVTTSALPAVTHVDGTARVQSVRMETNPTLYRLLQEFKIITGYGVLCNTSLNFKGVGFINRISELIDYCDAKHINEFVVDNSWYSRLNR